MRIPTDSDMRFPDEGPVVSGFIMSENIDEIAAALNSAIEFIFNPENRSKGYNYKYTELDVILEIIREANEPNGLFLQQHPWSPSKDLLGVTSMVIHSSGQWMGSQFSVKIEEQAGMNWNQSCGALLTYMRRYSAMSLYSFFPVDEDTDGITTGEKAARELKKKKAKDAAIAAARTPEEVTVYEALKDKLTIAAQEGNGNLAKIYEALDEEEKLSLLETDKDKIKEIADNVNQG